MNIYKVDALHTFSSISRVPYMYSSLFEPFFTLMYVCITE